MRGPEARIRARIFERAVRERQMILLHYPIDADEALAVVGNAEAHRVRCIGRNARALLPGIAEIAKLLQGVRIRQPLAGRRGAANARPRIAQRHGRRPFPGGLRHALDREETRTRHWQVW
jgi:hypothetical protein